MSISEMTTVFASECRWKEIDVAPSTIKCVLLAICETGLGSPDLMERLVKMTSADEDTISSVLIAGLRRGVTNYLISDFNPWLIDSGRVVFDFDPNRTRETITDRSETEDSPRSLRERLIRAERKRVTKRVRYEVFQKHANRCVICGRSADDGVLLHVDHVVALANGGTSDADNLQVLCEDCNIGKGTL